MSKRAGSEETTGFERTPRRRVALVVSVVFALGIADVVVLLTTGLDPVWGLMILPPILFVTALTWISVTGGIGEETT